MRGKKQNKSGSEFMEIWEVDFNSGSTSLFPELKERHGKEARS